jgi:hypothetical protein
MSETPISLTSLMTPSKTVTIPFEMFSGVSVDVCYLSRPEVQKLRKKCVNKKWNKQTHQPTEEIDDDMFLRLYCAAVVKGWTGLKLRHLEELLLVDISQLNPDDPFPYTEDNALELMKNASDFDVWVTETVGELENFTGTK